MSPLPWEGASQKIVSISKNFSYRINHSSLCDFGVSFAQGTKASNETCWGKSRILSPRNHSILPNVQDNCGEIQKSHVQSVPHFSTRAGFL